MKRTPLYGFILFALICGFTMNAMNVEIKRLKGIIEDDYEKIIEFTKDKEMNDKERLDWLMTNNDSSVVKVLRRSYRLAYEVAREENMKSSLVEQALKLMNDLHIFESRIVTHKPKIVCKFTGAHHIFLCRLHEND